MSSPPVQPSHRDTLAADLPDEAVVTIDERDVIRSWNDAATRIFGYHAHEIVGRPLALLVPAEFLAAGELERLRREAGEAGGVQGFETERLTRDGRRVRVSITRSEMVDAEGRSLGQCCVVRDVGVQRALIHQLYGSEKLAALRTMAVGLAHELGNPLTGVMSLLQLAERRTREDGTRARLVEARLELARVGNVLRELTDFTRADGTRGTINVNEILHGALVLARYAHQGAPVATELVSDPSIPALSGSRNHLLQVCLHVVMNAYDAMADRGGYLTVRSRRSSDEVECTIEDTGAGIAPDVLPKIFEPLFTTKPEGMGTGLGLFVSRRIVTQEFGGTLTVESEPGVGSRFTIRLPLRARGGPSAPGG